jgi:S1-C subfamily serine protease
VLTLDGIALAGADDLVRVLSAERIGRNVALSVLRQGRIDVFYATPGEKTG